MYPNEIQAIRKLRSAVDVAVNSLDALKQAILKVQPEATKLAGAVDDDIERTRQLQAEANELFTQRFTPPSYSMVARHARTALLSLAGPIDESDIIAAKERLRMIIDMIECRPATLTETAVDAPQPTARYNKGIAEYSAYAQPRLPNCPHYMSGWNEAARDYTAEMQSERRPGQ